MKHNQIALAAIISPGKAIFGEDLLGLTAQAWDLGLNLTGAQIRNAHPCTESGGVLVQGTCEIQYYGIDGKIDN